MAVEIKYIKKHADKHLRHALRQYPSTYARCVKTSLFSKWAELCRDKLKQLDSTGSVGGKLEIDRFIEDRSREYADKILGWWEKKGSLTEEATKFRLKEKGIVDGK